MRLALVIYGSLTSLSGGYLYDRKLVETLERWGDAVEVISLPWRSYARHLGDNLSSTLLERLSRLRVDALLQDELNHPSLFFLNRRLKPFIAAPIVSIVHHLRSSERRSAWLKSLYAWIEAAYLRSVDGFVFNSRTTQSRVAELAGSPRPGVVATPAADHLAPRISEEEIAQRALQAGPLRLLFVGNLIPRKGLHTLLRAIARLPARSFTLDVVGSPQVDRPYAASIRRQVADLGLAPRVRLHGTVDEIGLKERLRQAHALAVPSSYEGFGIVYLEAMGFGLACVGTHAGAAGEVIEPEQTGFLLPPEDPLALSACLLRLAEDRQLLMRLSLAARRRYLAHPTWQQGGERIRAFLQTLVASHPSPDGFT